MSPKLRVLICDDDELVRRALRRTLIGFGFDVVATVSNGEEALGKAQQLKPDLITMDVDLGTGISGVETCRRIQRSLPTCVVMVTGELQIPACGSSGYVWKGHADANALAEEIKAAWQRFQNRGAVTSEEVRQQLR